MARGQQIFTSLFAEHLPMPEKQEGKGRSDVMNQKRNECLVYRFLYYGQKMPHSYGLVINNLSNEFFLTERRVTDVIGEMTKLLRTLKNNYPPVTELRKRWPHMVW